MGGGTSAGTRRAIAALAGACATLAAFGCGETATEPGPGAELSVYVSLPLRGPLAADGRDAADGARLALDDAEGKAAGFPIRSRLLDDTEGTGRDAAPSSVQAAANARSASEDSTAIAYLGELTSGATRASLPVTNEARMLQVSPGAGAVDLVSEFRGSDEVPATQPRGERSFGRVIPADDLLAGAMAGYAAELDARRVRLVEDGSAFGRELGEEIEEVSEQAGIVVERGEPGGSAELLIYAGEPGKAVDELAASLAATGAETLLGPDTLLDPRSLPGGAPPSAAAVRAVSAALDPRHLPAAGRRFARRFRAEYGRDPGRYGAYGYEAMALVLDSVERAADPADRQAVTAAFFETEARESILGTYSITDLGETTLDRFTGYRLEGGRWRPEERLAPP